MRLDKFLCDMNMGTRSQVKAAIRQGLVTVGGVTAKAESRRLTRLWMKLLFGERSCNTVNMYII